MKLGSAFGRFLIIRAGIVAELGEVDASMEEIPGGGYMFFITLRGLDPHGGVSPMSLDTLGNIISSSEDVNRAVFVGYTSESVWNRRGPYNLSRPTMFGANTVSTSLDSRLDLMSHGTNLFGSRKLHAEFFVREALAGMLNLVRLTGVEASSDDIVELLKYRNPDTGALEALDRLPFEPTRNPQQTALDRGRWRHQEDTFMMYHIAFSKSVLRKANQKLIAEVEHKVTQPVRPPQRVYALTETELQRGNEPSFIPQVLTPNANARAKSLDRPFDTTKETRFADQDDSHSADGANYVGEGSSSQDPVAARRSALEDSETDAGSLEHKIASPKRGHRGIQPQTTSAEFKSKGRRQGRQSSNPPDRDNASQQSQSPSENGVNSIGGSEALFNQNQHVTRRSARNKSNLKPSDKTESSRLSRRKFGAEARATSAQLKSGTCQSSSSSESDSEYRQPIDIGDGDTYIVHSITDHDWSPVC